MISRVLCATGLVAACAIPAAQAADLYAGVGTTGFLVGVEHHYSDTVGVRADLNGGSLSRDASTSDATYHGTLHLAALGLFADYHPWGGAFRLSAGALLGDTNLEGQAVATANGTFTINGVQVSAPGESLTAKVKLPSVRPFVGLGWGHAPRESGLFGQFDLGLAYGRPEVTLTATPNLAAAAASAGTSVESERVLLQNKANDFRLYPVVRAGLGYSW
jgi:opacity protein-like surface antigen